MSLSYNSPTLLIVFRSVYSCSLNGEIIQWDVSSYNCLKVFSIPNTRSLRLLDFGHGMLWCGKY